MEREAYHMMDRQEAFHWWFVARRRIIDALIEQHVRLPSNARILEAGCGTGGNLALLASHGALSAFEYDPEARAIAKRKSGLEIVPGALPGEVAFADESFDMVALLDVLEHLDEDAASLATLRRKLASGGKLLLTVPAAPWLWSAHDVQHHHKRRYTKAQLRALLGEIGFADVKIGYFNSLLFPLAVLDRLLGKLGLRKATGSGEPSAALNSLFEKIFSSEAKLLRRLSFPFGLSLYAIAARAQ